MEEILQWVCGHLLLNPFEFTFWLHIINQEPFDIINVRELTGAGG